MADKIKLENIIEEYACGNCRHLVEKGDKYCWRCGELLADTGKVEHHYNGKQLTDAQYKEELKQYGE